MILTVFISVLTLQSTFLAISQNAEEEREEVMRGNPSATFMKFSSKDFGVGSSEDKPGGASVVYGLGCEFNSNPSFPSDLESQSVSGSDLRDPVI